MTLWSYRVLDLVPGKDVRGNAGPSGSLDNLIFFYIYILFFVYPLFSIFCADPLLIMIPSPPMWQSLFFGGLGSCPVWLGNIGVYN